MAPVRTCVGCRAKRPQTELVRVAIGAGGGLTVGRTLPGRGAWLCADRAVECADLARRKQAFARALRRPVAGGQVDSLRSTLAERERIKGRVDSR